MARLLGSHGATVVPASLITSDTAEFRDLAKAKMLTRGVRSLLAGRLRRGNHMPMKITVLDGEGT